MRRRRSSASRATEISSRRSRSPIAPRSSSAARSGRGQGRDEAIKAAPLRTEALDLIPRVARWAEAHNVRAPIFRALAAGVTDGKKADSILLELMTAPVEVRA